MGGTVVAKRCNVSLSAELLAQVDTLALRDYASRSDIIRNALREYLRKPENIQPSVSSSARRQAYFQGFQAAQSVIMPAAKPKVLD